MEEKKKINWDKIEKEGRCKILWLDKHELLSIFASAQTETNIYTLIDLPDNWRVFEVYYSSTRRAFGFIVFSDKFSETPIGAQFPDLEQDKVKKVVGYLTIKS